MDDAAVDALLANNNNKTTNTNNMQECCGVAHGGRTTRPQVMNDSDNTMVLLLKVPHQQHWVQRVPMYLTKQETCKPLNTIT